MIWSHIAKRLSYTLCTVPHERLFTDVLPVNHQFFRMHQLNLLKPPKMVDVKKLDRNLFVKNIEVPSLNIASSCLEKLRPVIKPILLKVPRIKPVMVVGNNTTLLLNPTNIRRWEDIQEDIRNKLEEYDIEKGSLSFSKVELSYENWNADEILASLLPNDIETARGFSKIGHIIHLNLRDHLLDYKHIIGEVLMDKIPGTKTVVYKTTKIDNTYRNFQMELICGENNMVTKVKENNHTFEFDFSKVYWNPRLSTEHQRIVDFVAAGDVLFDVFSGVGPFAVPCAKKKSFVYANDLNPECYKWLNHNFTLNKVQAQYFKTYNKDGRDFIKSDLKENLLKLARDSSFTGSVHVTMNLPAVALEFVNSFHNIFESSEITAIELQRVSPFVHLYFFVYGNEPKEMAFKDFEKNTNLSRDIEVEYHYVRNVSPKKDMVRLTFRPPVDFLCDSLEGEPAAKRPR